MATKREVVVLDRPEAVYAPGYFGFVRFKNSQAVGFQFPDPTTGIHTFASIPGVEMRKLALGILDRIQQEPEILQWGVVQKLKLPDSH